MAGGLIQIVSHGTMDLTLTGNPEITFFNIIYRRYTNFGILLKNQAFDNDTSFGTTSIITIPRTGQLLSKLILKIDLPEVDFSEINIKIKNNNVDKFYSYYDSFIYFINKLKNITNNFFKFYNYDGTNYTESFSNYILNYLNINDYNNFFISISSFYDITNLQTSNLLTSYYNASLFKITEGELVFIYNNWDKNNLSFDIFQKTIYKNIEILYELNKYLYQRLLIITNEENLFKISWTDEIAINLFNKIDLFIGSNKISSLSESYIKNYGELYYKNKNIYKRFIGGNQEFNVNLLNKTVYLVIPFWFNKNYGLSVPLTANYFNPIQIKLYIKPFAECIKITTSNTLNTFAKNDLLENILQDYYNEYNNIGISMLTEYIFLDDLELKKFSGSSHEYLITQTQQLVFENLTIKGSYELDFFHCCKELFWNLVKKFEYSDIFVNNIEINPSLLYYKIIYDPNILFDLNNFINSLFSIYNKANPQIDINNAIEFVNLINYDIPKIIKNEITINGTIFSNENSNFYRFLQPYIYYNSLSIKSNTNIYSFSLNPTEFQPAGTINFGKIPIISLITTINSKYKNELEKYKLIVETSNYNILRFIGGVVGLAYTYNY
jgi:hypothetical protein